MKSLVALFTSFALFLTLQSALGGSATWKLDPTSGDWNTAANWTPETVPQYSGDTATFDVSNLTAVTVSMYLTDPAQIVFNPGASAFTITCLPTDSLDLFGQGIINNSGIEQNFAIAADDIGNTGEMVFISDATVGDLITFTTNPRPRNGGTAYSIEFQQNSSAGGGTFVNQGGTNHGALGGATYFYDDSTAANSTLVNDGGTASSAGGGLTFLTDASRADNATLIANGGVNGGAGGMIQLRENCDGGTARVDVFGNGTFDVTDHSGTAVTIGSLEGDGSVTIGRKNLSVGSNALDTTFSGVIEDAGTDAPGTLTKIGNGALTLGGANAYNGGTFVEGGTLLVTTNGASGTGSGAVQVDVGTLGGSGMVAGAVTVGNASGGGGAFLSPGVNGAGKLTIQNSLSFNAGGIYTCEVNLSTAKADEVVAHAVAIKRGALFFFVGRGTGALAPSTILTVIRNTAREKITGAFLNLADGSTFTAKGNTFQASYEGGDGNDLTLTVVP